MVGLLGCNCCAGCCPNGNTWSYNYYPYTPQNWPLTLNAPALDTKWLAFTPQGAVFKSPVIGQPLPYGSRFVRSDIESKRFNYLGQAPPLLHGFGKFDLRNLKHTVSLPTAADFEAWDPWVNAIYWPNSISNCYLEIVVGLAIQRVDGIYGEGWSVGFTVNWIKYKGFVSGVMQWQWKMTITGWTGDANFGSRKTYSLREYGLVTTYTNTCPTRFFWLNGDNFPNELDLKSQASSGQYDCRRARMQALTAISSDNLSEPVWTIVADIPQVYANPLGGWPTDILSCNPYYLFSVEWGSTYLNSGYNFNNSKVTLKQTDWTYGERIP